MKPAPVEWVGDADMEAKWAVSQDIARDLAELATTRLTHRARAPGAIISNVVVPEYHSFGYQVKFNVVAGRTVGRKFPENPACAKLNRHIDKLIHILYHTCKNVSQHPLDGGSVLGDGQEAYALRVLRDRYGGLSEARVRSLIADIQSCTLQEDEGPDVFFLGLYSPNGRCKVFGCITKSYIPMFNQLVPCHRWT